ncbi:MAG: flavin reductase family protein [Anaerolineales bacterium]|nr:flavin reductase family protein [Anaerolineales bacterium]MCX7755590.1 flavin reductase family protein [Anaerolineales bacterium]MDW8277588.1 flavin reductase family protein [Anaerolineales bacterium]
MTADPEALRRAMRQWATGVAIVTASHNGISHGMTVSSFTSVSLTPPQVLISLAQNTRTHALVRESRFFGVTLLSQGQEDISDRFAGRTPDEQDRLAGLKTFTLQTGVPLLEGGLAHFDCRVIATFTSGTHTLFIGAVLAAQSQPQADPLLYYDRAYRRLAR